MTALNATLFPFGKMFIKLSWAKIEVAETSFLDVANIWFGKKEKQSSNWWCCLLFYFCINSMEKVQRTFKSVVVFICETKTCTKSNDETEASQNINGHWINKEGEQGKWRNFFRFCGGHCTAGRYSTPQRGKMYFVFCRLYPSSLQPPRQCLAPTWAPIFKRLWSPGIGSKEWIPPAYVTWRAGTITLFLLGS